MKLEACRSKLSSTKSTESKMFNASSATTTTAFKHSPADAATAGELETDGAAASRIVETATRNIETAAMNGGATATNANGQPIAAVVVPQNGQGVNSNLADTIAQVASSNAAQSYGEDGDKPTTINYTCTYCTYGADKLKKMTDHLKLSHPNREKTCMDNVRQQLIRLPNEDLPLPPYTTTQNSPSVKSTSSLIDNLSSSLINLTSSLAVAAAAEAASTTTGALNSNQNTPKSNGKPRRGRQPSSGSKLSPASTTIRNRQQQPATIAQLDAAAAAASAANKMPTILTMDANSQIIIDFNQNDDLACSHCDYTMNNLNYMRTHIKFKHKGLPITFQNRTTIRYYTIVEWPLTPVPTLTPPGGIPPAGINPLAPHQPPPQQQQQQQQTQVQQNAQQNVSKHETSTADKTDSKNESDAKQGEQSKEVDQTSTKTDQADSNHLSSNATSQTVTNDKKSDKSETSINTSTLTKTPPSKQHSPKTAADNEGHTTSSKRAKVSNASTTSAPSTPAVTAGGISINTNNVSSILKKLGVNVSSTSSPLSSLISSIGSGTKTVNNSVVNVNLNSLKDVNFDDMTDDDDDEERKFLIRELEKKANSKKQANGQKDSNAGGDSDSSASAPLHTGGVKRSRSNSSTLRSNSSHNNIVNNTVATTKPSNPPSVITNHSNNQESPQLLSQLNITLNCHYCWAQFQLNVSKNLKTFQQQQQQQKENGKYMQHLTLHLNAPYKCNECSYPITDTKTFFKHKQFYKHDEKSCIMVDNDVSTPTSQGTGNNSRRKTLVATRLKQQKLLLQQQQQSQPNQVAKEEPSYDRDVFKCSLCFNESDPLPPSTSVSFLNKIPTPSSCGASNCSYDKEQVLKHVLIVHLSFLAYKCDTCTQFYAFDEPQTKQHAALVHQCGTGDGQSNSCHFKLIKTEEEINLAINKAQQSIAKIPASTSTAKKPLSIANDAKTQQQLSSINIDAQPKYKCCKCTQQNPSAPIVLYNYQDALDHVITEHMVPSQQNKKDKKVSYELELFEQNLEDLFTSSDSSSTTNTASSNNNGSAVSHLNGVCDTSFDDDNDNENDEENGELVDQHYYEGQDIIDNENDDQTEWSYITSEPSNPSQSASSGKLSPNLSSGNRRKRFKTGINTSINTEPIESASGPKLKRFYYKPCIVYKCQLCSRKMNKFDVNHWLQHDQENNKAKNPTDGQAPMPLQQVNQQINIFKTSSSNYAANNAVGSTLANKTFANFTEFLTFYQSNASPEPESTETIIDDSQQQQQLFKQINCLVCSAELKCSYSDALKHFQTEHQLNLADLKLVKNDLELIHTLQINNQVQTYQGVRIKRRCFIKIPSQVSLAVITKADLINKEINLLNEIYQGHIIDKQIVSWLNSEQFMRRNFNYNSYVCIICNSTKMQILESHYNKNTPVAAATPLTPARLQQYFTDEMKTVVLTNHILTHFNEYCYRCMSCKISWPDKTQLLKHSQECPNSQVVRTKTKYKLKANCRQQLKFYLQTYLEYWAHERHLETKTMNESSGSLVQQSSEDKNCIEDDPAANKENANSNTINENKPIFIEEENDADSQQKTESPQQEEVVEGAVVATEEKVKAEESDQQAEQQQQQQQQQQPEEQQTVELAADNEVAMKESDQVELKEAEPQSEPSTATTA